VRCAAVDFLDLKIVRTMGFRPYGPRQQNLSHMKPSFVAAQLGVEPETVKSRLARMEESGFIRFYQVYPNFRHLGLEGSAYLFQVPDDDRKAEAIERIEPIEGLIEVHNFLGPDMCFDLSYRTPDDLSRKLRLLSDFTGDRAPLRFYDRQMPAATSPLTSLDWRILRALRYRGRQGPAKVAENVGVSVRTVRRRFDRMAAEGSFFIVPAVDAGRAPGLLLYELLFFTNPDADAATLQRILKVCEDRYIYHYVPASQAIGNFDVFLAAESANEIEELRQRTRRIPGVAKVSALVFRGWKEYTDWIDTAIDEKIRAT